MGRLFWKFFFFILLAQVTTIAGLGVAFAIKDWARASESSEFMAEGGPPGPRWREGPMDGRPMPPRRDAAPLGPGAGPRPPHLPPHHRPPPGVILLPWPPMVATLFASLIFAGLLAWYVAKPIRHLRRAFAAAAAGNLDMRLEPVLGRRRDELSDLGRDFDHMAERLRELMTGQQRLLHQVSHELRSPLARLQAAIGLGRQAPEKLDAMLERIEREAARMDQLVGELLTLSRLESGLAKPGCEEVDVGALLADIVEDACFESAAGAPAIKFEDREKTFVAGNPELLHRAFENVVRNAIRYSPPGGRVSVQLSFEEAGSRVHVSVCDQGPGVSDGDLNAIFRPFYRADDSTSGHGHGLGLAIAQQVIAAHHGSIRAVNQPEGGLCVEIELPIKDSP